MRSTVITIGFFGCIIFLVYYNLQFTSREAPGILQLELAERMEGKTMLSIWKDTPVADRNLISTAKRAMTADYIFILFYVAFIFLLSNDRMQQEKNYRLNVLLRMNLPAILIVGILDAIENGIVLYDVNFWFEKDPYVSAFYFTLAKFLLTGWVVMILLLSYIKKLFNS